MPTKLARPRSTVTEALEDQKRILELFGTVPFDPKYNYKKQRGR